MKNLRKHRDVRGFTLIELVIVIVILGILATFLAPKILDYPDRARQAKAKADIGTIEGAIKMYKVDNGVYPTTEQGLEALISKPETAPVPGKWREGGYLEGNRVPLDPWDNPYYYASPGPDGKDYEIISYGRDKEPGGTGPDADIANGNTSKE